MTHEELEDLYIRSLDENLAPLERQTLVDAAREHADVSRLFDEHRQVRDVLAAPQRATFGAYFATRLMNKIQNTGAIIDRELFGLFKRFQLAALGVVVVLLILNFVFTEQISMGAILGLEPTNDTTEELAAPFNLSETFNDLL